MHCIWHPQGNHTIGDCRIFIDRYARKGKNKNKEEDNKKKDEDNPEDKGFQQPKGTIAVIFFGVLGSRSLLKCVFGVPSGQLLRFLVSNRGIEASTK
jgi:hypothetical protein